MSKRDSKFQSNLVLGELEVSPGEEWRPRLTGWTLVSIKNGSGYCLQPGSNTELETGSLVLLTGPFPGTLRASQLGALVLGFFSVLPERLTSLLTLSEQHRFRLPPDDRSVFKILPPRHPAAVRMSELLAEKSRTGLLFRLRQLQVFAEVFAEVFVDDPAPAGSSSVKAEDSDALDRLQGLLREVPVAELMDLDFNELAARTHCTPRHLSRIFCKAVGMSFSDKRAELRLARAEELLATSNIKVVQVALESGYNSLSQFNLMFIRRYGISPGRWRERHGFDHVKSARKKIDLPFNAPKKSSGASRGGFSLLPAGKRQGAGEVGLS